MFTRQLRKLIGFRYAGNVTDFSRKLGKRESVIRNWLNGAQPRLADVARIARQERVPLDWLAFGFGPDPQAEIAARTPIGERLRAARGSLDVPTFARLVDLPSETIEAIEAGESDPNASTLARLGDHFDLNRLVRNSDSPGPRSVQAGRISAMPPAEDLLTHIVANGNRVFCDRFRAAAADELHRMLSERIGEEPAHRDGSDKAYERTAESDGAQKNESDG